MPEKAGGTKMCNLLIYLDPCWVEFIPINLTVNVISSTLLLTYILFTWNFFSFWCILGPVACIITIQCIWCTSQNYVDLYLVYAWYFSMSFEKDSLSLPPLTWPFTHALFILQTARDLFCSWGNRPLIRLQPVD